MPETFVRQTIALAVENVHRGGGPFAAVVVCGGAVIATGVNQVTLVNDPTAHAEVVAIREACRVLGSFQLAGCDLYTSCEPCPMCLGAIYWARPARVIFAATRRDAAAAGFDDEFIYNEISLAAEARRIPMLRAEDEGAARPFDAWLKNAGRTKY